MSNQQFMNFKLTSETLDTYFARVSIFNALKNEVPQFNGAFLDVGCGKMPYKEYILENSSIDRYVGLDIEDSLTYHTSVKPDFYWNGVKMPFENNSYDCIMATEVLEHCPDLEIVLKEIYRVLKPGGSFFFTVPFLWPLHDVPYDEYRYTPFVLERQFLKVGFIEISIKASGGWHASMAQMLGLWVKRSPLTSFKRSFLSFLFKPIIKILIKKDDAKHVSFSEGQMVTGLYGLIKKQVE